MNMNSAYCPGQHNNVEVPMQQPSRPGPVLKSSPATDVKNLPRFLYHYTSEANFWSILHDQVIFESKHDNPGIRHGRGVYLTSLNPVQPTEILLKNNFGFTTHTRQRNERKLQFVFKFERATLPHFEKVRGIGWDDRDIWVCREDIILGVAKLNFKAAERVKFNDENETKAENKIGYVDQNGNRRKWRRPLQTLEMLEEMRAGRIRRISLDSMNDEGYNSIESSPMENFDEFPHAGFSGRRMDEETDHFNSSDTLADPMAINSNSFQEGPAHAEAMHRGGSNELGCPTAPNPQESLPQQVYAVFIMDSPLHNSDVHLGANDFEGQQVSLTSHSHNFRGRGGNRGKRGRANSSVFQRGRITKKMNNRGRGGYERNYGKRNSTCGFEDYQHPDRYQPLVELIPRDRHLMHQNFSASNLNGGQSFLPPAQYLESHESHNSTFGQLTNNGPSTSFSDGNPCVMNFQNNFAFQPIAQLLPQHDAYGQQAENPLVVNPFNSNQHGQIQNEPQRRDFPNPWIPKQENSLANDFYDPQFSDSGPFHLSQPNRGHNSNRFGQPRRTRGRGANSRGKRGTFRPPR